MSNALAPVLDLIGTLVHGHVKGPLYQACFTLAKTLRDVHEGQKFMNRLD